VQQTLAGQDGFRSAQDVYAALRSSGHSIGLSTVYRHLQTFTEQGLADVIHTAEGETTYRFCGTAAREHHHHLVCRDCGRAEEIEAQAVERWARQAAGQYGFTDIEHTVELFGQCPACRTARARKQMNS
jgi:Fur family ferric uptake transcriptional regulator